MNIGIEVLFILAVLPVVTQQQLKRGTPGSETDNIGHTNGKQMKRAVRTFFRLGSRAVGIWKGKRAMETLLKGTKKLGTAGSLTKYRKHGDYNTAVKDFDSVNPIDVKIFDGRLTGVIGNRIVMLATNTSQRYSVMVIRKMKYTYTGQLKQPLDHTDTNFPTTLIEYIKP